MDPILWYSGYRCDSTIPWTIGKSIEKLGCGDDCGRYYDYCHVAAIVQSLEKPPRRILCFLPKASFVGNCAFILVIISQWTTATFTTMLAQIFTSPPNLLQPHRWSHRVSNSTTRHHHHHLLLHL